MRVFDTPRPRHALYEDRRQQFNKGSGSGREREERAWWRQSAGWGSDLLGRR